MATHKTLEQELTLVQVRKGVLQMSRGDLEWAVVNLWEILQDQQNIYEAALSRLKAP